MNRILAIIASGIDQMKKRNEKKSLTLIDEEERRESWWLELIRDIRVPRACGESLAKLMIVALTRGTIYQVKVWMTFWMT